MCKLFYVLECQTYLDDSCLASSVYLRNFECGLSSNAPEFVVPLDDCDAFDGNDVEPDAAGWCELCTIVGGVGLFDKRLLVIPLELVLDTLFGECDWDGGVRREWAEADSFCALAIIGSSSPSSLTKCTLDKWWR